MSVKAFPHGHSIRNREEENRKRNGSFTNSADYQMFTNFRIFGVFQTETKSFLNKPSINECL